jgi:hypothetical protein
MVRKCGVLNIRFLKMTSVLLFKLSIINSSSVLCLMLTKLKVCGIDLNEECLSSSEWFERFYKCMLFDMKKNIAKALMGKTVRHISFQRNIFTNFVRKKP